MAHQWQGIVKEYFNRLPVEDPVNIVTLGEGGTPLILAESLSELTQCDVYIKVEGTNPTGSFKDRGMAMALTAAAESKAQAVVCASTGNTSASAAAYALRAGLPCIVLVPDGKIAMGKLSQTVAHGATLLQVDGNFDDCLKLARQLSRQYPILLVNSVNPARLEGQKTGAFEIVDALGDAPDIHILPVGNAGNISAYWKGYIEYSEPYTNRAAMVLDAHATKRPQMWGFQAAGAAPFVTGAPVSNPETVATAIRIGNPASWDFAIAARDESGGFINAVSDKEILAAHRYIASKEGIFVEPASAVGVAGLLRKQAAGEVPREQKIVITVTGHGLKDPQWALQDEEGKEVRPQKVACNATEVAAVLSLS